MILFRNSKNIDNKTIVTNKQSCATIKLPLFSGIHTKKRYNNFYNKSTICIAITTLFSFFCLSFLSGIFNFFFFLPFSNLRNFYVPNASNHPCNTTISSFTPQKYTDIVLLHYETVWWYKSISIWLSSACHYYQHPRTKPNKFRTNGNWTIVTCFLTLLFAIYMRGWAHACGACVRGSTSIHACSQEKEGK